MIASKLISQIISPLRTSDTGEESLTMMNIYHVKHLPIVNNESFLGIISEDDILNNDMSEPIGSYRLSQVNPFVFDTDHFFDVMKKIAASNLSVIPVIDKSEKYLGLISIEDLIKFYADSFSFNEVGAIIVLKLHRSDYSLSEISRIVEENNAVIITSFISSIEDSGHVLVSIKFNTNEVANIKASFERFGYDIYAFYTDAEEFDSLKEHYESLMKYLSI